MKLSKRLECIADCIAQIAVYDDKLADIGTDHGYLPCFLTGNKVISYAYACDVAKGPLASSKETIAQNHVEKMVEPLLGNGLEPILDKDATIICLAGMGGFLMEEILDAHLDELPMIKYVVVQANICIHVVRACLNRHGFKTKGEVMVEDAHHIYEVLIFERGEEKLNEKQLQFGPLLLENKPALFYKKWQYELAIQKRIIPSLDPSMDRYKEVMAEITAIEAVLK